MRGLIETRPQLKASFNSEIFYNMHISDKKLELEYLYTVRAIKIRGKTRIPFALYLKKGGNHG